MDEKSLPPVRFRAIIEMSFPEADPMDPTDYDRVIEEWRKALEENPRFNCTDVVIKEILAIGEESERDYNKWRQEDVSHIPPGVRITGGRKNVLP